VGELREAGGRAHFFNINAADPEKMESTLDDIVRFSTRAHAMPRSRRHAAALRGRGGGHAGADGHDGPSDGPLPGRLDTGRLDRDLMGKDGRIFAMTSSGSSRVIPSYGPVSAAKAALESHCRQLAWELAPRGITANALRGGVTDTPALRKIPGSDALIDGAVKRNPSGRLTTPEDVAAATVALCSRDAHWITGNVINVDGGEEITA
jgi:enoyl-[acyl-carrier protein] reductase III